jgi:hypothetical protein
LSTWDGVAGVTDPAVADCPEMALSGDWANAVAKASSARTEEKPHQGPRRFAATAAWLASARIAGLQRVRGMDRIM